MVERANLLLLGLTVLVISGCTGPGPEATAESFYHHLNDGEIEAALGLISSQTVGQVGTDKLRSGFQQISLDIQKKGGIDSVEAEQQGEGDAKEVALVSVTVHYGDGTSESSDMKMVLEDGAWKLLPQK